MAARTSLLLTDVDNTLYDWVEIWHSSFSVLLSQVLEISGVPREVLLPEIRNVHRLHGTSEYSHLIQELPSLVALHPNLDIGKVYAKAIDAAKEARRGALRLYPGVWETLKELKDRGSRIGAYTESLAFYTAARFRSLRLDGIIDVLYSSADHSFPPNVSAEGLRKKSPAAYGLQATLHQYTPVGALKPSAVVLRSIVEELADEEGVIYVGDSLMKDVAMAQAAGVPDALAAYGAAQYRPEYELLRQVSHWSDESVAAEKLLVCEAPIVPGVVFHDSLAEVLETVHFVRHSNAV